MWVLSSTQKILKCELCAVVHQGTKIPGVFEYISAELTHFMHHLGDNGNQNLRTLDGRNKFYGMGIIGSATPVVSSSFAMPRSENVLTEDIIRFTEIKRKIIPSSRRPLRLNFIELNEPINAFDSPRSAYGLLHGF